MTVAQRLIVLAMLLCVVPTAWPQGRLGAVRDDIRRDEEEEGHDHSPPARHSCGDEPSALIGIDWLFGPHTVPIRRPRRKTIIEEIKRADGTIERTERIVYEDDEVVVEQSLPWGFPAYPYPMGLPGYMQPNPTSISHLTGRASDELRLKSWSVRLAIEDGHNWDGLNRFNGRLLAETDFALGMYTSWNWFHEDLPRGRSDDATIGNITVTWRSIQNKHVLLRVGAGIWTFSDDVVTDTGINLHLSADIFPARPVVISTMLEGGGFEHTGVFHARCTVGYLYQGCEFYAGYDFLQVGNTDLEGPLVGVRFWF